MTREETVKLLSIIVSLYPNFHPDNMTATADAWAVVLKDDSFATIQKNLIAFNRSDRTGFAPTIGQLLAMSDVSSSAEEEWVKVRKAICDSTYHAQERFNELPPKTQAAVGNAEMLKIWASTDISTVDTSIAKQFKDAYRNVSDREVKQIGQEKRLQRISTTSAD